MRIKKVTQPEGSNLCGQAIVAMLGNISLKEAINIMGTAGLSRTKHLLVALKTLGLKVGSDRLLRVPREWIKPELCVIHIQFGNHWKKHWTLWIGYKNCFFDPAHKSKKEESFYNNGWTRMLSYLEIRLK